MGLVSKIRELLHDGAVKSVLLHSVAEDSDRYRGSLQRLVQVGFTSVMIRSRGQSGAIRDHLFHVEPTPNGPRPSDVRVLKARTL